MRAEQIPLDKILTASPDDEPYIFTYRPDTAELYASIETSGLLVPPVLREDDAGQIRVICGSLRIKILRQLGRESVKALVVSASEWTDAVVDFYWSWVWPDQGLDFSGSKATMAPEWTLNASYEHRFDLGSIGTLTPQIDAQYKTDYILSFDYGTGYYQYPWNYQEAHYTLNGSLSFNHSSGSLSSRS